MPGESSSNLRPQLRGEEGEAPQNHFPVNMSSWRRFNWLCIVVVLAVLGVRTWGHRGTHKAWTLPVQAEMSDYAVNTRVSAELCQDQEHRYWSDFVYPPPAVLLWHGFGKLEYPAGAVLWLALLGTSLAGAFLLSLALTGEGEGIAGVFEPPSGLILALAFGATEYYCLWDLHVVNTNSIYLFLVLSGVWGWVRNRRILAGILLGASVALKIYSIVFLPFLLFRREWRVLLTMLASLVFFFLVVPVAYFGMAGAMQITRNWLHTVASANGPDYLLHYSGYRISLSWMTMLLLDPRASEGKLNVLDWGPEAVRWLLRLAHAGWLLLVLAYFARARSLPLDTRRGRLALALDASVLLLLPLPLSPFLQPPHPVTLLLPAVVLLRYSFESGPPLGKRLGAALAVASGCFVELTHYPWRGIGVMLTIAVYFAAAWTVRRDLAGVSQSAAPQQHTPGAGRESAGAITQPQ